MSIHASAEPRNGKALSIRPQSSSSRDVLIAEMRIAQSQRAQNPSTNQKSTEGKDYGPLSARIAKRVVVVLEVVDLEIAILEDEDPEAEVAVVKVDAVDQVNHQSGDHQLLLKPRLQPKNERSRNE